MKGWFSATNVSSWTFERQYYRQMLDGLVTDVPEHNPFRCKVEYFGLDTVTLHEIQDCPFCGKAAEKTIYENNRDIQLFRVNYQCTCVGFYLQWRYTMTHNQEALRELGIEIMRMQL